MSYYGTPNTSPSPLPSPHSSPSTSPQSQITIPLQPIEVLARNHGLLCSIGFLILLPLGSLFVRYVRTFTHKWFCGHAAWQLLVAGPIIFAGWALGSQMHEELGSPSTPHSTLGVVVMGLYVLQVIIGIVIHYFKPAWLRGHRLPQNYLHVVLGLVILALAANEVYLGLTEEWPLVSGGTHKIPNSVTNAWMALIIVFWVLYGLGMALLPRQYKQEAASRKISREEVKA